MKNKLFFGLIMVVLFVFGILIYDFSDEMDEELANRNWYMTIDSEIYVLTLRHNLFNIKKEDGTKYETYRMCSSFQYNSNVSMLKLKCEDGARKIYITNNDDNKLILNDEGEEYTFYNSKEIALIEDFKHINELSDEEYDKLLSISFKDELFITYDKFMSLYNSKKASYVAFINNKINYQNVYKYVVLNNLISNSSKKFYLINVDNLSNEELKKIDKLTKEKDYSDKIYVFELKKKTIKSKVVIEALNKNDLINYQNI